MKTTEIPIEERERVELDNLPQKNILKAISEYMAKETEDKTGGLIINFVQKDGKELAQKYGKISGRVLIKALDKLGIKDTEDLQKDFYEYVLTEMRSGYPRYIPIRKIEVKT